MNSKHTFYEIVENRRSIRAFLPEPVPLDILNRCLDAALSAPSSSNLQLWRFVVIGNPEMRKQASRICLNQPPAQTAPLLVALVARPGAWRESREAIIQMLASRGDLSEKTTKYYRQLVPLFYVHGPFNLIGWLKPGPGRLVSLFRPFPDVHSRAGVRIVAHKSAALAFDLLENLAVSLMLVSPDGFAAPWIASRAGMMTTLKWIACLSSILLLFVLLLLRGPLNQNLNGPFSLEQKH